MNLRAVLKIYREHQDLSLKQMAQKLQISIMDLSRFERGRELSGRKMAKIAYWIFIDGQK